MKRPLSLFLLLALPVAVFSQSKNDKPTLQPPPHNIVVDGSLAEWGDSLRYFNAEKKINYSIANDGTNLYFAMRINDHTEQRRTLAAGITITIDPKGKKKDTYAITFPYVDPETMQQEGPLLPPQGTEPGDEQTSPEERMQARLTRLKQIKATGFPDVVNEIMTTANTYGVKTALNFDADGYLVYEAAVPIAMFHADDVHKNEWAFNFKINGIDRSKRPEGMGGGGGVMGGMGGGRGGMGGGRGGRGGGMRGGMGSQGAGNRAELEKSVDFWEKFYLAR